MDSDKYLEGQSMQIPPLFQSDHFIYWKNRFETYVKAKDLDLWHIILNGDFPPVAKNEVTQVLEDVPFEEQSDDLKKKLAKNNEAKMVLYNALPKKESKRIFICKTAKDIWQSLLITHQVPGLVTHFVASLTLDSARSCVIQDAFLTQEKASSIPTVFSLGNSISPDGFLPSILLLLVIIVAVAIVVTVILVVVVVGEGSSIIKLSFVIIGSLHRIMLCYLIH
ncbi:hypothetical protein Tco_1132602 [Tanacetum coccineum]|uniref:DUF4219 domain-containing protein n=1 Tax=Tanacetum coccineum TaxID=301880 RepID=A0ABQ5JDI2_9ASTR